GSPIGFEGVDLNRYPDPAQQVLRSKLSARLGVSSDMIFVGVGSDEIIDLLIRLTCEPSTDAVAILDPTYGVYRIAAELNAVQTVHIPLDECFQIDMTDTLQARNSNAKIIFCCSPNNPTGNLLRRRDILTLCRQFKGLTVVDEAYIEFSDAQSLA